jgi:hypothetical protein
MEDGGQAGIRKLGSALATPCSGRLRHHDNVHLSLRPREAFGRSTSNASR